MTAVVAIQMKMLSVLSLFFISSGFAFSRIGANSAIFTPRGEATIQQAVVLEDLPYDYKALEPHIGEKTLRIHHGKHHAKYVATCNDMIKGTDMEGDSVMSIVRKSYGKNQGLFNNAGQSFSHDFYWKSMKPNGGGKPSGRLLQAIEKSFGSYDAFRAEFIKAANTAFGSGWAWLVHTAEGLKVTQTIGANNPLTEAGQTPLLTVDVWEHAYYLDYQNLRPNYVDAFLDHLVNWDMVEQRMPK